MKSTRLALFLLVALVQLAAPASMIWKRQRTFREGRVWKFHTAPVDPVDAVRGRYLSLRFSAEEFAWTGPMPAGEIAYVTLKEDAEGFAIVDQINAAKVSGDNVLPVDRFGVYENKGHVFFSFDKFWITEANAGEAERAYAAHSNIKLNDAYVTVRVHQGDAAIEELYLGGQPLRDYLRNTR